ITSVTFGFPSANVPVLSHSATEILLNISIASPLLNSTPFDAPLPIPTIIAVGVANPRAHRHATTNIATAGMIAIAVAPAANTRYQVRNTDKAATITAYAKYPAT